MTETTRRELLAEIMALRMRLRAESAWQADKHLREAEWCLMSTEPDVPELVARSPPAAALNRSKPDKPGSAWRSYLTAWLLLMVSAGMVAMMLLSMW